MQRTKVINLHHCTAKRIQTNLNARIKTQAFMHVEIYVPNTAHYGPTSKNIYFANI